MLNKMLKLLIVRPNCYLKKKISIIQINWKRWLASRPVFWRLDQALKIVLLYWSLWWGQEFDFGSLSNPLKQLSFFRKGLKTLEAVEPCIRNIAEKHRIDYQLSGLCNLESQDGEPMSGYESTDDGELSFDYRQKKQGLDDDDGALQNPMEVSSLNKRAYAACVVLQPHLRAWDVACTFAMMFYIPVHTLVSILDIWISFKAISACGVFVATSLATFR